MAGGAKKWLMGCGIGCGIFILLAAVVGTVGFFGVRKAIDRGKVIESGYEELKAQYGAPEEFVPEPDGAVPAARMLTFLAVREALARDRQDAGDILRVLDGQTADGTPPNFLEKARAGLRLVPVMMNFVERRNQELTTEGMGLGEYYYIYSLAYFNEMGKDLADGPSFTVASENEDSNHAIHWDAGEKGSSKDSREDRERHIRRYLHGLQLQMARNQLAGLIARGGDAADRARLEAEIEAMGNEPLRLLWETDLPEVVRASLAPYRDQLEASYDPMTNVLEAGLVDSD